MKFLKIKYHINDYLIITKNLLKMENPDELSLTTEITDRNKDESFGFYRAYCNSESEWLGNWNSDQQVAINSKNHHERNNPSHSVSIRSR